MSTKLRDGFFSLSDQLLSGREAGEEMRLWFEGERSDFVRFNKAAIRQPGNVEQSYLNLELIRGKKHCSAQVALSGDDELDRTRLTESLARLRLQLPSLPDDPYLLLPDEPRSTEQLSEDRLPPASEAVDCVLRAAGGSDFVGILAGGGIFAGFASSLGQRSWFSSHSFHLDFSLHAGANKAIKQSYAGFEWSEAELAAKMEAAKEQLGVMEQPMKELSPGGYDVYLSPAALEEITSLLCWDSFSLRAQKSKTSALLELLEGESSLSPAVTLRENTAEGVGPSFDSSGFVKPPVVELIQKGKLVGAMVSPRSAVEYGVPTNAASEHEFPVALELEAGELSQAGIPERLGNGIFIGNLWYLNYSDRRSCRITGMTRFGTFWVEDGKVVAPVAPMRFDESIYRLLGANLEGLTRERDLLLDPGSYFARSTRSARLPGALVRGFRLTL